MLVLPCLVAAIIVVWSYWLWTRRRYYAMALTLPGPIGLPLLGVVLHAKSKEEILPKFEEYRRKFGTFFFAWLGTFPIITVSEPSLVQDILTSPHCINKSVVYKNAVNAMGDNISTSRNPDWSFHRKHMNPAFSHKVLLSLFPIFNEEVNILKESLATLADNNTPADISGFIHAFTLNVATRTTMGKSASQDAYESKRNLLECHHCISQTVTAMVFFPFLAFGFIRKLAKIDGPYEEAKQCVKQFTRELIDQKLANNNNNLDTASNGQKQIFIDAALDLLRQGIFSRQEVENESNVIVFGAYETTANTVLYALILLAMFPEYQEKLYDELVTIFPTSDDFEVSYENIQDMVYMDMVLNESMRILTPIPIVGRETASDVKLSNGVVLPPGVQISIFIHGIHRSVDLWGPNANQFNPENFLPSNMATKHPYAFIPFSKGIRNCIGWRYGLLSIKVTLAKLVRKFKFTTDFQFKDLVLIENITLKLKHMPTLKIQNRKQ